MSAAIFRAHPHEPMAGAHVTPANRAPGEQHPRRNELVALGALAAVGGALVLIGGVYLWSYGSNLGGPFILPSTAPNGATIFWLGTAFGAVLLLLGIGLVRWPEYHPEIGVGIVVTSALTLLAGPLLYAGFLVGLVAGALAIALGSPAAPRWSIYTPSHVTLPVAAWPPMVTPVIAAPPGPPIAPPPAPAAPPAPTVAAGPVPPAAGKFCLKCGRSVSSQAEFCPWCGASQAPAPP